jgi:hypothetical protein
VESIFDPAALGYTSRPVTDPKAEGGVREEKPNITGYAAAPDASDIWVSLCVRNDCGDGGMGGWTPGSETVLLRSRDGGASWSEVGRVNNSGYVIALAPPDHVLVGTFGTDAQIGFAEFPGMTVVSPPESGVWPLAVVDGQTVWRSVDLHQLWVGNEKVMTLGDEESVINAFGITSPNGARPQLGVAVQKQDGSELLIVEMNGEVVRHYDYDAFSLPSLEFDKGLVLGNAIIQPAGGATPGPEDYRPVAFDLTSNSVRPISQLTAGTPGLPAGRNRVIAANAGPFAKIAGADPCAQLHSAPSADSEVLDCLANGVLVVDVYTADKLIGATPIDGWLDVLTLAGEHGYVARSEIASQ